MNDVKLYKLDLQPVHNLKATLREIRDYFAGNVTGITRDETIAQTMLRLLFCKINDPTECKRIANQVRDIIEAKTKLREQTMQLIQTSI